MRGGRTLGWDEAMALLRDRTGRPGPATWESGDYPEGQGEHAGHRRELVRGGRLRRVRRQGAPHHVPVEARRRHLCGPADRSGQQLPKRAPSPVATLGAISPFGTHDMAGNAKEWCWNAVKDGAASSSAAPGTSRRTCSTTPTRSRPSARAALRLPAGQARSTTRPRPEAAAPIPLAHARLRQGEAGAARGRAGLPTALRLRQAAARRPDRGDRRQLGPLAEGEGQLHGGLRWRAGRRLSLHAASRDASVPDGGVLPRLERDPPALQRATYPGCPR